MVIITTNTGQEAAHGGRSAEEERKHFITRIQQSFPAEFLARVDDLLVFVCVRFIFIFISIYACNSTVSQKKVCRPL